MMQVSRPFALTVLPPYMSAADVLVGKLMYANDYRSLCSRNRKV